MFSSASSLMQRNPGARSVLIHLLVHSSLPSVASYHSPLSLQSNVSPSSLSLNPHSYSFFRLFHSSSSVFNSFILHSFFIHFSFILHSFFIHSSFNLHSFFIHSSFILHSFFIHSSLILHSFFIHFHGFCHNFFIHSFEPPCFR